MVKGALAFSLSLIVGTALAADTQTYGATFEPTDDFNYTLGDGITNAKYRVTENVVEPYGWFAAADDESKIIERVAEGSTQALQLNTDANTLTNKFAKDVATGLNNAIAADGAFFETEVKFVASDTLDAGIKGGQDATKFAIYAYCDETDPENITTNLVVFHAVMDANGRVTYTNEVFDTPIDCDVYTKLRIEMKKLEDPATHDKYNAFSVTVGSGSALESKLALDALFKGTPTGTCFLTVEDPEDEDAAGVSSLNFKGTGEIDNISVGVIEVVPPVATVFTVVNNETNKIGDYTSLAAAFAAATNGTTVLVLDNLTLEARVEPNVGANTSITIDLGGKTITRTGTSGNGSVFDVKSGDVLIKNGTINCTQDDKDILANGIYAITARSGANVTLTDLAITVNSKNGACAYPFAGAHLTITSGTYANTTDQPYQYHSGWQGMAVNQANVADKLITISGGSFSQMDPQIGDDSSTGTAAGSADFTAGGYVAIRDGNDWVVQAGYNVTFDANGGTPAPEAQRVAAGGKATAPATAPTKEGVTFGGWKLNNAAYDFDTVLRADITLVASWTQADEFKAGDDVDGKITQAQADYLNSYIGTYTKAALAALTGWQDKYLLNVDPFTGSGTLTVTAITVGNDVRVTIALARTEGETAVTSKKINGVLKLYGTDDLADDFEACGSTTIADDDFSDGDTTTATFTGTTEKFFKAVIDAPAAPAGE